MGFAVTADAKHNVVASPNHAPFLDFLRASAAFLVVIGHARHLLFASITTVDRPGLLLKGFWLVTVLKHEAVIVFFVLSGFLVGGSIFNAMSKNTFDLKNYLIARFSRIYIVYVPALPSGSARIFLPILAAIRSGRYSLRHSRISAGFMQRFAIWPTFRDSCARNGSKTPDCGRSATNGCFICLPPPFLH
jgi:peptidoglycan/LPS O-acetylase OafA/YrhL